MRTKAEIYDGLKEIEAVSHKTYYGDKPEAVRDAMLEVLLDIRDLLSKPKVDLPPVQTPEEYMASYKSTKGFGRCFHRGDK